MLTQEIFAKRRSQLFSLMQPNSIAILPAAPERLRSGETFYRYRQDSDFHYLTNFDEPDSIVVLIKEEKENIFILFNKEKDINFEQWSGPITGQEEAILKYGANISYPISTTDEKITQLIGNKQCLYYPLGRYPKFDRMIERWFNVVRTKIRKGINTPPELIDVESILHEMRLIKSPEEIQMMRKSAEICSQALIKTIKKCQANMIEYELEAELIYEFKRQGAYDVAFLPIIASGVNSCILHYINNNSKLENGNLVLIDTGCEYNYYASDMTRTFPVNGRFSDNQRAIYDIVLKAQLTAINEIKPGNSWIKSYDVAVQIITEGLVKLGILNGNPKDLIAEKSYETFFMTKLGHWIGIDVHDVGKYKIDDTWRTLKPGMVLTIEPGIYIAPNTPNIDKKWLGIGIRIEDEVLVTANGNIVLTSACPKTIEEIENLMKP